ncbi:SGNH/GDSL hydrolase family protein [Frigoribacterium endophyticum]|uniref:SGNH/GDSL hydrolase family protein n=1 Tax=Frigoribacterium endophyticum TaxID=1522176 RepID=UPI00141E06E0|nr:SGNH/GDSL hydrolase family protein [Frigoribacterium endophyticum]NII52189.1 lysophospholipase L1-like esterase [Frigoribacterium endophyticum]
MPTRHTAAAFFSGVGVTLAATAAAGAGVRSLLRHRNAAAADLNALLPVHSAWWRARFDRGGALLYVAMGDSAAQGIGASSPARSYVGRLSAYIRRQGHTSLRVVNLSVSGSTTWLCRKDQLPKFEKYEPDVVTVAIGANDIIAFDPESFEKNIRVIYGALPSHAIVGDLPAMWIPDREKKLVEANRIVRRVADEFGLTVAPLYATTRKQGFFRTYRNSAGDLFHPNDRGYRVWASAFEPAVAARVARIAADRAVTDATATVHDAAAAGAVARTAERRAGRAAQRGTDAAGR